MYERVDRIEDQTKKKAPTSNKARTAAKPQTQTQAQRRHRHPSSHTSGSALEEHKRDLHIQTTKLRDPGRAR